MPDIIGTPGDDTLTGTANGELIDGLGGDDIITDTLGGADTLRGGDGNDVLTAVRLTTDSGNVIMEGGEGDDRFFLNAINSSGVHSLSGGNGADYFDVTGVASVQAGDGDDYVVMRKSGSFTLGPGADTIFIPGILDSPVDGSGIINDFTPGAGGDRIDWGIALAGLWGWDQASNPFGTWLRIVAGGSGTYAVQFRLDSGTPGWHTLFFTNDSYSLAALTAYNLGGYTLDGAPPAAQTLNGDGDGNILTGGVGSDTINGQGGDDQITGGAGADTIDGGDGDDVIDGGLGSDTINGGTGSDTITDAFGFGGTINGGSGGDTITVDLSANVQPVGPLIGPALFTRTINGGDDDDTILAIGRYLGSNYNDFTIDGGAGNDRIEVSTSKATVQAGDGNDLVIADIRSGGGTTVTLGAGVDTVRVGALLPASLSNPTSPIVITDFQPGAGGDVFDLPAFFIMKPLGFGYVGNPFSVPANNADARLVQVGADVQVQVGGPSTYWTLAVLQNVTIAQLTAENFGGFAPDGTPPADQVIDGDGGANELSGGHGNDTIRGQGGEDVLTGGFGNDLLQGGDGDDQLDGQWASDTLEGEGGNDILVDTLGGNDTLRGGDGDDFLTITRTAFAGETLVLEGGAGNDMLSSPTGTLNGGDGDDIITATAQQFAIIGGTGNDTINASAANAAGTIDAGAGDDVLNLNSPQALTGDPPSPVSVTLGAGHDLVVAGDRLQATITDFKAGEEGDQLDLSVFGADPFRPGGPLLVEQVGADTVIRLRQQGVAQGFRITLLNVQATDLSTYNLSGEDTHVFGPAPRNFTGTPGPDEYISADGNDTLSGLGSDDILYGAGGNDSIDGGAGADDMYGGTGNDIYFVDQNGDEVFEDPNEGRDVVYASANYTLAAGTSVEVLSANSQAAVTPLELIGNELVNEIYGNAGANFLDGGGAADYLAGLGGNDTYIVDNAGDVISEGAGGGRDVVYARANYTLTAGQEVEVLSAISQAATTALQLTGNEQRQEMYGNAGANFLDGGGGADYMQGFGGNDTYIVDNGSDYVFEAASGGRDVIYAKTSFTLAEGTEIEVLSVISQSGGSPIDLTGNSQVQELYGNTDANFLDGGGGADYMQGFAGNDSYVVETQGDVVVEAAGEGRDVVYARASYTLAANQSIEVLSTIQQSATTAINLTGNNLANELYGNAGANTLNGGLGADYLQGFGGADTFQFTTALGGGNVDQLADFLGGTDKIALDDAIFGGIGTPGAFNANAFVVGTQAGDADDRIIYNSATGQLSYDADGNGAGAAVLFATLSGNPALAASDFQVI